MSRSHRPSEICTDKAMGASHSLVGRGLPSQTQSGQSGGAWQTQEGQLDAAATVSPVDIPRASSWAKREKT